MKILHTSDWHLGKRLNERERMAEQIEVMDEIVRIAGEERVDAVVVAGDLFDTYNPPVEAIELLYRTLYRLADRGRRLVVAIAGNHDSPDRIDSPDVLAKECGIFFVGNPMTELRTSVIEGEVSLIEADRGYAAFRLPGYDYSLRIIHTPYTNEQRLKKFLGTEDRPARLREELAEHWQETAKRYCDDSGVNLLIAHLFVMREGGEVPEEPEDERPIQVGGADAVYSSMIPAAVQYAGLGHLHRYRMIDTVPCPVVYSGSPLSYSFSEAEQQKYVVLVEVEPGKAPSVERRVLKSGCPLVRKRFYGAGEAIRWLNENPDVWVELTVVTDTYLTAAETRAIYAAHDRIVWLIPEVKNESLTAARAVSIHELRSDVNALFAEYFKSRKGQEPNKELMTLFQEVLAKNKER
ncbi:MULTISPECIES: metallophosphoesterase family protein [Sanguibacteroides]|uniref:Nuclease SbcCD subunit D n=1 Tax=Sanguibacteroides justesenii TaxID=1547597 RepID=A0A0C3RFV1_9PORP|nr:MULTISPECIES: exonuclease subunit SbcD [Sanguibacteroides]KIO45711.1 DNA repair exonuclease [Sanguibacteroides justesenii]